jgi:flagellar protein FliL
MAESKQGAAPAPAAAQAPVRKRPSKKLVIIVAATLTTLAGGAGAFFFLKRAPAPVNQADRKEEARKLPNFVDLEQFTVNLAEKDQDQDRYMQIRFSLEVASHEAEATIKDMMPALRSEILLVLGARQSTDLATRAGKEALAKDIVDASNKSLEHTGADHSVTAVRITQLIVQ